MTTFFRTANINPFGLSVSLVAILYNLFEDMGALCKSTESAREFPRYRLCLTYILLSNLDRLFTAMHRQPQLNDTRSRLSAYLQQLSCAIFSHPISWFYGTRRRSNAPGSHTNVSVNRLRVNWTIKRRRQQDLEIGGRRRRLIILLASK